MEDETSKGLKVIPGLNLQFNYIWAEG